MSPTEINLEAAKQAMMQVSEAFKAASATAEVAGKKMTEAAMKMNEAMELYRGLEVERVRRFLVSEDEEYKGRVKKS